MNPRDGGGGDEMIVDQVMEPQLVTSLCVNPHPIIHTSTYTLKEWDSHDASFLENLANLVLEVIRKRSGECGLLNDFREICSKKLGGHRTSIIYEGIPEDRLRN